MKIAIIFIIFSTLSVINSSLSSKFHLDYSINDKTLSSTICKITNDITSLKSDTQDILIGNLGGKMWPTIANDIIQCLNDDKAQVLSDFRTTIKKINLRKASVVILTLDKLEQVNI